MKMALIQNRKKAIADMAEIDPEIVEKIKPIQEQPEIVAASEKFHGLDEQLKAVVKQIDVYYHGQEEPNGPIPSAETDATEILQGKPASELTGQSRDTSWQNLQRQRIALEKAIEMQKYAISELYCRLIREGCEAIRPIAVKFVGALIEDFEQLAADIEAAEKFFAFLNHRGYEESRRPAGFSTTTFEKLIYYGGIGSLWSLRYWIEKRREIWGLETKK